MILYTPLPMEAVLDGAEPVLPAMMTKSYQGRIVMGYQRTDGHFEVARLLSTDPQDYLDPGLQPGQYLAIE
ncbi:YlzJ-like family protein [Heliophilum fasciatum]|uniref:YlzJ-like protein n=1 Tax=Heliophilum fasciatum TaxID=35700 RepID=A0A4R2RNC4_9FIRM|nr:YlzJ-like family protein [Heliophilum fasciatum]MCW2277876.1 hypothetical protein [Heliophilum fasciatum]TCP64554.1 YlzJ-like protein [Heliophilum fasciatum]